MLGNRKHLLEFPINAVQLGWMRLFSLSVVLVLSQAFGLSQPSTLIFHHQELGSHQGSFKPDFLHHLSTTTIARSYVIDTFDCVFKCMTETTCHSFNLAAYRDSNGLYLCELLTTDKYRASESDLHENGTFHHFSPLFPCHISNPCHNNGDCVHNFEQKTYQCDCQPGFAGLFCDRTGKTCSDIKSHSSQAVSASYVIDPDGQGGYEPFTVYCDMTDRNEVGVTVVSHDSESRTLVDGYDDRGSYERHVHYIEPGLFSVAQLAGLPIASAHCEQFIKYECLHSVIFFNGNKFGWWVSRNSQNMTYWGGATPTDNYKCACGLTSSCGDPSYGCNWDANDHVWREDSGLLTEKSDLPVLVLRFGDSGGSHERGYHTLGKFKCYGNS